MKKNIWKRIRTYGTKAVSLAMAAVMLVSAAQTDAFAEGLGALQADAQAAVLEQMIEKNDAAPMPGGMLAPATFSDEEISACEITDEQELGLVSEEEISAAEEELSADLLSCYEEDPETVCVAETDSVSGNRLQEDVQPEQLGYATMEDAARYVREQMVKRKKTISVRLAKGPDGAQRNMKKILEMSTGYYDGCSPKEGDYIYWNFSLYRWRATGSNAQTVSYRILIDWRSGASEEAWVDVRIPQIIAELGLNDPQLSDHEKVARIYDFIMATVDYDYINYAYLQYSYMPMYTAYHALKNGKGVCQAYALIFYRLCREIGIDARLIAGNDKPNDKGQMVATHGWNIVQIGEYYYNVDATWDDETATGRAYFLKNKEDFEGHSRDAKYETAAFLTRFPTAEVSYSVPRNIGGAVSLLQKPNTISKTLTATSGKSFSTSAGGKNKILIFQDGKKREYVYNVLYTVSQWSLNNRPDCEIAIIDIMTAADYTQRNTSEETYESAVMTVLGRPANLSYVRQSDETRALRNQYAALCGGAASDSYCCMLIGADNVVRYFSDGPDCAAETEQAFLQLNPPPVIAGSAAQQIKNDQVKLSWMPAAGMTRYYVYRKSGDSGYICVGTTTAAEYVNSIPASGVYTYKIYASDGNSFVAESGEIPVVCSVMFHKNGQTVTANGLKYKILTSTATKKTAAFAGVSGKAGSQVLIPDTVTLDGLTYQVTEITKNAMKNQKKVTTVSIGKNVTAIGEGAFMGCGKLSQIVVEGKGIKKVGKNAFKKTAKKAVVFVPGASLKKYKKLFKGKGLSSKNAVRK